MADDREQVAAILRRINDAWSGARFEELTELFDENIVIRGPELQEMSRGREAAVKSYSDFTGQAEIRKFEVDDLNIDVTGDTAAAVYRWSMTYLMSNTTYEETGHDVFVFRRDAAAWRTVWRALLTS